MKGGRVAGGFVLPLFVYHFFFPTVHRHLYMRIQLFGTWVLNYDSVQLYYE